MTKVLIVASFSDSITAFRGALVKALLTGRHSVHVAAPAFESCVKVRTALEAQSVVVHNIPMNRTGNNPFFDLRVIWRLFWLMRRIRPDCVLSYTIKPVIFGSIAAWLAVVPRRFALVTGLGYCVY